MRAFICGLRMQVAISALTPFSVLSVPLVPVAYGVLIASLEGGLSIATLVGVAFVSVSSAVIVQAAILVTFEKAWHSLQVGLISPTPISLYLLGRMVTSVIQGVVAIPIAWGALLVLWEAPPVASWPQVVAALAIGTAGFLALGLILVALLVRFRYFAGMINGIHNFLALACGFFVPIAALPAAMEWTSWLLSPSWALAGLRDGQAGAGGWGELGVGLAVAGVTLGLAVAALARVEHTLRRHPQSLLQ